jgi:hypothetical protein
MKEAIMDDILYTAKRNPNLPWGYWLVASEDGEALYDEDGNAWDSVRDYLWTHRLRMGRHPANAVEAQLEFLLAILVAIDRRVVKTEESVRDIFHGHWHLQAFYAHWLEGVGLASNNRVESLTQEGRAVLVMLASTRSAGSAPLPIGLPALTPRMGLDRGETRDERERVLASQEAFARDLPYRFVREAIADRPGIKLMGVQIGSNIPLTRILWSMSFPDDHARDRMFAWLAHRIDRWEEWGELSARKGARVLSELLLELAFADRPALTDP